MLNNKGQSLILFVICLPILLFILILIIDIGKVIVLKHELDSINEIILDYGLNELNNIYYSNSEISDIEIEEDVIDNINNLELKLTNFVKLNKDDIDVINIKIDDNKIYIDLIDNVYGMFSSLINISIYNVKSSYVGYVDNNVKKIERISGE